MKQYLAIALPMMALVAATSSLTVITDFTKYAGKQCWGTNSEDLLRDFVGTAYECKQKCRDLGDDCVGFIRVNSGSSYEGQCFFRRDGLQAPEDYTGDDRDCYEPVRESYTKYEGLQCWGSTDVERDFAGTATECAIHCSRRGDCVGFIRVNSGSEYAGKCYLRGGTLTEPEEYTADRRDCYAPSASGSGASGFTFPAFEIVLDNDWMTLLTAFLVVLLIINIGCLSYRNCCATKKHGYKEVTFDTDTEAEA